MTILWCGAEEIDYAYKSSWSTWTIDGYGFRNTYSRCAISATYKSDTTEPCLLSPPLASSVSSFWLHAYYKNYQSIGANRPIMGMRNNGNEAAIAFGQKSTGQLNIYKISTTGTPTEILYETGTSIPYNNNKIIDFYVSGFGTASGTIKVYVDLVLTIDQSGVDLTVTGGETDLDQFVVYGSNSGGAHNMVSEVIIADQDTRNMSVKTLAPNASGDTNDWTNDYGNIDEIELSDGDIVYTDQVDDDFQANLSGLPTGEFSVKAVKTTIRATDSVGSRGIQVGVKTNSVIHLGSTVNLDAGWQSIEQLYNDNPETTNPFTEAEITALQLAFRSKTAV